VRSLVRSSLTKLKSWLGRIIAGGPGQIINPIYTLVRLGDNAAVHGESSFIDFPNGKNWKPNLKWNLKKINWLTREGRKGRQKRWWWSISGGYLWLFSKRDKKNNIYCLPAAANYGIKKQFLGKEVGWTEILQSSVGGDHLPILMVSHDSELKANLICLLLTKKPGRI